MSISFLLDTNTVSFLLRDHPLVSRHLQFTPFLLVGISSITEAELWYGLAKRPEATRIKRAVEIFLNRVAILPWTREEARQYGELRAQLERNGIVIAAHDLLIATHAISLDAILVSNDQCFRMIPGLKLEDWTMVKRT